jgi:hypothetical protein
MKITKERKQMTNVKVTYSNGDTITTAINGTIEAAKEYFLGNIFNIGSVEDNMQTAVKVEEIKNNPWVWTELTESLKPERKAGDSVPTGYLTEGHKEYYPYQTWIQKGYVTRKDV